MDFENVLAQLLMNDENNNINHNNDNMKHPMESPMESPMEMPMKSPMESMTKNDMVRGAEMGDLPCNAPVAMTYTPWQRKDSRKYTAGEALDHGTLYPGLDLPLHNNYAVRNVANGPAGELQALDFAILELGLYLDTHRTDMEAFQLFKKYVMAYKDKKAAYIKQYGPLMQMDAAEANRYNWTDDPWPWDYSDRR